MFSILGVDNFLLKMPETHQSFKRQVAYKVGISDILDAHLIKDNMSLYIKINDVNVSRVNLISTLVYKAEDSGYASSIIDDGTGRMSLKSFEKKDIFSNVDVGDMVLVIGKIREFSNEKYIVPEIVKKVHDPAWIGVRKIELQNNMSVSEDAKEDLVEENPSIADDVFSLIRKLDSGEGVLVEDIIKEYDSDGVEKILKKMLENGDVFEITPGKIKILE